MQIRFNDSWQFSLGEADKMRPVALPHDWLIDDPKNWYQSNVGWYQRQLDASFLMPGQRAYLRFDGVYMNSTLYVNSRKVGEWKNGFTAFEHDITDYLSTDKDNTLLLKVDARFPSVRWYSGAGIYRDVTLVVKNACHFVRDGITITTFLDEEGQWQYEASQEVEGGEGQVHITHEIVEQGERLPWSPEAPHLYTLRSTLIQNGQVVDVEDTRFGFRHLRFDPDEGFFINGAKTKLNGVCLHQEFAIIGAAVHRDFIARQFLALKRMGVNAVRTAHNAPSRVFMDLCEEMGLLVVSEFSDVWQINKTDNDYARYFDAWHERDVASWVRRDRNSPSLIMWSLGNEIPDTNADVEKGSALVKHLYDLVKSHDEKGQALPTLGSNYMAWENTQQAVRSLKAVGYNYAEFLYQKHHLENPDWVIYGSETCSTVQSRGIYHFPLSQPTLAEDDLQVSSLGNSTTSWGTKSIDHCIKDDRDTSFSIGQFVWSGQDYLGEPTPYQTKNSYFGMLDTAGFEKDAFYLFQSAWTNGETKPMVHLFPHWDFSPGQMIDLRVCTNQRQVKLFFNDALVGEAKMEGEITRNWQLPYEPGIIKAEAYDENGVLTATCIRESFHDTAQLALSYEHLDELTFVSIQALDDKGRPVENANDLVLVHVSGGKLLGLDNGDASDYTPYQTPERRLFSGKLLAVVKRAPGEELEVLATLARENKAIRKIELVSSGDLITATCLPRDAKPQPLHWRLTNQAGVDSKLAKFEVSADLQSIRMKPISNGAVFVRCGVNNDKPHLDFYAQIQYDIRGFGSATINPYEEVSSSLYTKSNVQLESGAERGIATPRLLRSVITYENLDFGDKGSDEMSMFLFVMDLDPFAVKVYEGVPEEGGQLLAQKTYDLGSEWMVYKEFRIQLSKRMQGVSCLSLVFERKVHLRGFVFHNEADATKWVKASFKSELYGDNYTLTEDSITGIGNNTTVGFTGLRLPESASKIEIRYDSDNQDNPAQLQINHDKGQTRLALNLKGPTKGNTQVFELPESIFGAINLRLIFLPGCKLDLHAFRFLSE